MDNQTYLNQISNNSPKSQKSNFFTSKIFIFIAIAVGLFILIFIASKIIDNQSATTKNKTVALSLHVDNLISTISTYQPKLKSSELRGYSASLSSILSETSTTLSNYLTDHYELKESKYEKSTVESETTLSEELDSELFSAKINGLLDRTYAHSMAYEISIITARESEIYDSIKDSNTKSLIESSYNSLTNLYENFNNFSES